LLKKNPAVFASADWRVHSVLHWFTQELINKKISIGGAAEVNHFSGFENGDVALLIDIRQYTVKNRSTFIPFLELGHNFTDYTYINSFNNKPTLVKGGLQVELGMAYSYRVFKNGAGPLFL
jgi:hypothetical protein